ncbi:MAG: CBS domain-containing protein [Cyanobacteria bacterium P01_A01_bin.135]
MTRPIAIRSSATVEAAIGLMQTHQVRALIVEKCHEDGDYGILLGQDIICKVVALGSDPRRIRVGSLMRPSHRHLPLQATLQEAAKVLAEAGISYAPVIENHRLLGIVSVTDILGQLCPTSDSAKANHAKGPTCSFSQLQSTNPTGWWEGQITQSQTDALLTFESDIRSGCRTMF